MRKTYLNIRLSLWWLLSITFFAWGFFTYGRSLWVPAYYRMAGHRTVQGTVSQLAPKVEPHIKLMFDKVGITYPPREVALLAFKEERLLELWSRSDAEWVLVNTFKILGASGDAGPKLRQGDRQVPEGLYGIEGLNPNSSYHLSMKLNYPNESDRTRASAEGRTNLGGDIFIHGSTGSVGCLAMGDDSIEELFLLVHLVGKDKVTVIISPRDLRYLPPPRMPGPAWVPELYAELSAWLKSFPRSKTSDLSTQRDRG
jgi:hypothetical protein